MKLGLGHIGTVMGAAWIAAGLCALPDPARAQSCAGQTELVARSRALATTDMALIQRYLTCFPDGPGAVSVRAHEGDLRAAAACEAALASNDEEALRGFIIAYSAHECSARVASRLKSLLATRPPAAPPLPPAEQAAPPPQRPFQICASVALADSDLRRMDRSDFQACLEACAQDSRCSAFSYNSRTYLCSLKVSSGAPRPVVEAITGLKLTATALPGPGARVCPTPCGDGKEVKDGECLPSARPAPASPPAASPNRSPPAAQGQGQSRPRPNQGQGAPGGRPAGAPPAPPPPAPSGPRPPPLILG